MSARIEVLTADQYRTAARTAMRAMVASLDASLQRYSEVVSTDNLAFAADRLENVSSQQLREIVRDCNAELKRREATA